MLDNIERKVVLLENGWVVAIHSTNADDNNSVRVLWRCAGIGGPHSQQETHFTQFGGIDRPGQVNDTFTVVDGKKAVGRVACFNGVENTATVY